MLWFRRRFGHPFGGRALAAPSTDNILLGDASSNLLQGDGSSLFLIA